MNWYAKRLGLAYVYKLSEIFYIQDKSLDHKETWEFLARRIADLRAMKEAKVSSCRLDYSSPSLVFTTATAITAGNLSAFFPTTHLFPIKLSSPAHRSA